MSELEDRITAVLRAHQWVPTSGLNVGHCARGGASGHRRDHPAHVAERIVAELRPNFDAVVAAIWEENATKIDADGNPVLIDVVQRHRNMARAALRAAGWEDPDE